MSANRRRRGPVSKPEEVSAPGLAPAIETPTTEDSPSFSDTEEEGDMGDHFEDEKPIANKPIEVKPVEVKPVEVKPAAVMIALSRCRYKSGSEIVDAEAGDEIKNCDPKDLKDLQEHNCVETFEADQVQALFSLRGKDADAKQRLARAIGIIL